MKKYNYFLVNVPGRHGYSFMVATPDADLDLDSITDHFQDEEDAEYATYEKVDKYGVDYNHFKDEIICLD